MEQVIAKAAEQVPALVVLVVLSILFLRDRRNQAEDFGKMLTAQRVTFVEALKDCGHRSQEIADDCHRVSTEAAAAVREGTKAIGRVEGTLDRVDVTMGRTIGMLRQFRGERPREEPV